jgi:hypothetical protein
MVSTTTARRLKSAAVVTGGMLAVLSLAACGSQPNAAGGAPVPVSGATTPVSKPSTTPSKSGSDQAKPAVATKTTDKPATDKPATGKTLGSTGYGKLKLGMSVAQAKATGQLGALKRSDVCDGYDLAGYPTAANSVGLYFSKQYGLVYIGAQSTMSTPEGIKLGTTINHVQSIFPKAENGINGLHIPVPGKKSAYYTIIPTPDAKRVGELALATTTQDCFD